MQSNIELLNIAHWQISLFIIVFIWGQKIKVSRFQHVKIGKQKVTCCSIFNSNHCQNKPHSFLDSLYSHCQLAIHKLSGCIIHIMTSDPWNQFYSDIIIAKNEYIETSLYCNPRNNIPEFATLFAHRLRWTSNWNLKPKLDPLAP